MLVLVRCADHVRYFAVAPGISAAESMLSNFANSSLCVHTAVASSPSHSLGGGRVFQQTGFPRTSQAGFILPVRSSANLQFSVTARPHYSQLGALTQAGVYQINPRRHRLNEKHGLGVASRIQGSMHSVHAATAETAHAKQQRARQQAAADEQPILPAADTATSPFLLHSSAHSERARVDYSQAQRPLHVRTLLSAHYMHA